MLKITITFISGRNINFHVLENWRGLNCQFEISSCAFVLISFFESFNKFKKPWYWDRFQPYKYLSVCFQTMNKDFIFFLIIFLLLLSLLYFFYILLNGDHGLCFNIYNYTALFRGILWNIPLASRIFSVYTQALGVWLVVYSIAWYK